MLLAPFPCSCQFCYYRSMASPPLALWIRRIVSFFTSTSWPYAQQHAWISLPELDVDYEMVTVNYYMTSHKTFLSLLRAGWQTQFLMVLVPRCLSYCLQVLHQNNVFLCKKSHCITVLYIAAQEASRTAAVCLPMMMLPAMHYEQLVYTRIRSL
jgi:hypothetical protein